MVPQPSHARFTVCSLDRSVLVFAEGLCSILASFSGPEMVSDSGDISTFAEADVRKELDDDWDSGCGTGIMARGKGCAGKSEMRAVGVLVLLSG